MAEVLMKAGSFVAVIIMGNLLRRAGFFKEEDFYVLSKIVLRITLPAAIISNFSGIDLKPSMLVMTLLGFGGGILYISMAFIMSIGKKREEWAFNTMNLPGYNIGNFTMPFAQGFLGPMGVVATSLFDTGNAFICLGGSYSAAVMIKEKNTRFSILPVMKTLLKSVPFDAYLLMTVLSLLHVALPAPITTFTGVIGNANAFMAMLMIGVGFKLNGDSSQLGKIVKILAARYSAAIALALIFYFLLPFSMEYRQALTILALSPMSSAAPAFTGNLNSDVGLASAANSISVVISTVLITGTLMMIL
ncbi:MULTISPECIES: AEC family transporter [unclassified Clostridium]|uniref:AEC family transporter n=1 Tax=unclassified Clostridium TaxID=2614128 RepID=UPI0011067B65|nr:MULTISPECIES: AEC family transporter [unclassified Clostridium]